VTVRLGYAYYGFGYTLSCFVCLIGGFYAFSGRLNKLEFITFTKQKMMSRRILHKDIEYFERKPEEENAF
jgi:uncharacterized membrane protein